MDGLDPDLLPIGVVRVDGSDRIVSANATFTAWAGLDLEPRGRALREFLTPTDDFLDGVGQLSEMMSSPSDPQRAALVVRSSDAEGVFVAVMDASDRLAAGRRLRVLHSRADRTRARLQLVIDASIAFADATTEEGLAQILTEATKRAYHAEASAVYLADVHGTPRLSAGVDPLADFLPEAAFSANWTSLGRVLTVSGAGEGDAISPGLGDAMRATGVHALIAAPLDLEDDQFGAVACFFLHPRQFDEEAAPLADALAGQAAQTVAKLRLQKRLEHAAMHDETTGLPNRRLLEEEFGATAGPRDVAVMFIDLDGFKAVNDRLGHPRGDDVLREVARRLKFTVRDDDIVARYGGDEFVVVCDGIDWAAAQEIAERLREAVEAPYRVLTETIELAASIGVSVGSSSTGVVQIDRLIRAADQAMYDAKSRGGNRVIFALPTLS